MEEVMKISGGKANDSVSTIKFVNDFNFKRIKRFYQININRKNTIKAFHGHMIEEKYAYVVKGKFLLVAVKIDNKIKPSKNTKIFKHKLSDNNPQVVHIPAGYANGYKSLINNSSIIFFSTLELKESTNDDYRFDQNYWGENIWD